MSDRKQRRKLYLDKDELFIVPRSMLYWRLQRERTRSAPASLPGPPAAAEAGDTLGGGQPSSVTPEFFDQTSDEGIENVSEEMNCEEMKAVGRFYQRDTIVPFRSNETHELRPVQNMQIASSDTLSNSLLISEHLEAL
ncbi:hypothetical protein HPB51_007499 [Rhipicephalus microplus]|uniref:Uncharacterized protein n=1 Tax=Rhipicephalus microplus TaxID=6941 RepID=A0A9J6DTS5_RHIMP|nr:hypothetical protein HPB51_007499 [Rhipicephalus microplus]